MNKKLILANGRIWNDEWKKTCLFIYGIGGIKHRMMEIIKEDLQKLRKDKV